MLTRGAEGALFWHRASERSIYQRAALCAFQIECDFGVDAIVADFSVVHFDRELLDVERTNIPERLGRFIYRAPARRLPNSSTIGTSIR